MSEDEINNATSLQCTNVSSVKGIEYLVKMEMLLCGNGQLTELGVSGDAKLESLHCFMNQLESLNLSGCTNLKYMNCSYNCLTSLDMTAMTRHNIFDWTVIQWICRGVPILTPLKSPI